MATVLTTYGMRKRGVQKSNSWKLTAFQRLNFTADNVVECLKEENIIDRGGGGVVYRGTMPEGVLVTIKQVVGHGGRKNFLAEIKTLGKIKHRNIVRLLGYVWNQETNLLLYEYMPNGSVGQLLHGPEGGNLQWEMRYKIAI